MIRLYDYSTSVSASLTTSTFPSGAGYDPSARGGGGTFGAGPSSKDDSKKKLVTVPRKLLMGGG